MNCNECNKKYGKIGQVGDCPDSIKAQENCPCLNCKHVVITPITCSPNCKDSSEFIPV
jgi:fructoselysine-6-P-deglycase FrlB-like protein